MPWQIDSLILDTDKVAGKVGSISISFPDAHDTETFYFSERFSGGGMPALEAFVVRANEAKTNWVARRSAEDALKPIILNVLNP